MVSSPIGETRGAIRKRMNKKQEYTLFQVMKTSNRITKDAKTTKNG